MQFVTGVFVELSPAAARTLFGEQRYRALPVASMNGGAFTVVQAITASGVAAAEVSPVAALKVFGRALTDPVVYTAHGGTFSLFAAPVGAVGGSEVSVGVEGDTQPALAMPGQLLLGRVSLNGREYGLAVVSRVFGSEPGVSYESVEADPDLGGAVAAFEADNALYRGAWSEAGIGFADIEAPTPTRPGTWGELKIRYR